MSRFVPQPVISAALLLTWLLLHNAISVGLLLTGVLLAVGLPLLTQRFWPEYPRTIRIAPLLREWRRAGLRTPVIVLSADVTPEAIHRCNQAGAKAFLAKPVVAAIHGGCIGAGVDLASACDMRVASMLS